MFYNFKLGEDEIRLGAITLHVYNVSKDEVLAQDYEGVLRFIKKLDKLGGRKSFGHAAILIDGYNEVPEELHEIIEVRNFIGGLFDRVPHLLYYINFKLDLHKYLFLCISDFTSFYPLPKKNIIDTYKDINYDFTKIPTFTSKVELSKERMEQIARGTMEHAIKVKRPNNGMIVLNQVEKMFDNAPPIRF